MPWGASPPLLLCVRRGQLLGYAGVYLRTPLCKLWLTAYAFSKAQVKGMVASVTPYYYHLSYAPLALFMPLRMTSPFFILRSHG